MAVLALGLAGVALGNAMFAAGFMGISGAQIGWTIGSLAGSYFFGPRPKDTHQYGPRLDDLKVTGAQYGTAIPKIYGTSRVAGTMIWTADIREQITTTRESSGGKGGMMGGSEVKTTSYSYYGTWVVGLCDGPISGIGRIWGNGQVIGDVRNNSGIALFCSFQNGNETQFPNTLMQAAEGAHMVPAYRGLAVLSFHDVPLAEYGNRIPSVEIEVFAGTTGGAPDPYMYASEIVADIATQCGIDPADLDLSAIASDLIRGIARSAPMEARSFIDHLRRQLFFDLVEIDGKLVAVDRTTIGTVPTLGADQLGAEMG